MIGHWAPTLPRRLAVALAIALLALASSPLAALQLPQLDADRLVSEGRIDEARAAFEAWLSENAESDDLFAVLLRRMALDPDPESVQRVIAVHAASLSDEQAAALRMLPIDFAELSGSHERAFELLSAAPATPAEPARAARLAGELGADGAGQGGVSVADDGAAALYQRSVDAWAAGDQSAAGEAFALLVARYPASPERHLASLSSTDGNAASPGGRELPIVVPFPAPEVLLRGAYPALEQLTAAPADDSATGGEAERVPPAALPPAPGYTIQTGAYRDAVNADHIANQLRQAGFPAQVEASTTVEGADIHRVLVGASLEREAAQRLLDELRAAGYDGFLRIATVG